MLCTSKRPFALTLNSAVIFYGGESLLQKEIIMDISTKYTPKKQQLV